MRLKQQPGFSLVELLVALLIGSLVAATFVTSWLAFVHHHQQQQLINRLNDEVALVAGYISRELRRAGYWHGGSALLLESAANPFLPPAVNADGDCLIYSYDLNSDGLLQGGAAGSPWHTAATAAASDERFGLRLHDGQLQVSRDGANCSGGSWEALTTTAISVGPLTSGDPPFQVIWPAAETSDWQLLHAEVAVALSFHDRRQPELARPLRLAVVPRNGFWRHE